MRTRTRNGLILLGLAAALGGGLGWLARQRPPVDLTPRALDAVPSGALLVATADLKALRASPIGAPFLRDGREIPGLGKVSDVCGFDPMDSIDEVAVSIPAAGDAGEFGLVAAGAIQDQPFIACASKVIQARGGRPVVTQIGTFTTVRDAALETRGGEIAVRRGGPVLLGGGAYLRAMIDSADGRAPTIRDSVAHTQLAAQARGSAARITVVLTPEQRAQLADELALSGDGDSPAASILAGGLGIDLGPMVAIHAVIRCADPPACAELGVRLKAARDARAADLATQIAGFAAVLQRIQLQPDGDLLHVRVDLPADEAGVLVERLIALRGLRHPMPAPEPPPLEESAPPADAGAPDAPPADEVIRP